MSDVRLDPQAVEKLKHLVQDFHAPARGIRASMGSAAENAVIYLRSRKKASWRSIAAVLGEVGIVVQPETLRAAFLRPGKAKTQKPLVQNSVPLARDTAPAPVREKKPAAQNVHPQKFFEAKE